jgi:hypothetical protein
MLTKSPAFIDPEVLKFVAATFRDQMKHAGITIDDLASMFVNVDTGALEQQLGRRVTPAELLQAKSCCRKVMDRLIVSALDELHAGLRVALTKIADDGAEPE